MSLFSRIHNLWKLSAYEPGAPTDEYKYPGSEVGMITKRAEPTKTTPATGYAGFIPRKKRDPVKEITQPTNEN